jgi:hypothetical protein
VQILLTRILVGKLVALILILCGVARLVVSLPDRTRGIYQARNYFRIAAALGLAVAITGLLPYSDPCAAIALRIHQPKTDSVMSFNFD